MSAAPALKSRHYVSRETMTSRSEIMTPDACGKALGLSNDQLDRLSLYLDRLQTWQKAINLVGSKTLVDPWRRHILDSAQIKAYIPDSAETLIDLGSGAGFPGLVLAIMTDLKVTLIESDQRKCVFLAEVNRITNAGATIINQRIQAVSLPPADVVTARALAPIQDLCRYAEALRKPGGICLFLKGKKVAEELTAAREHWTMDFEKYKSRSDSSGTLVLIRTLHRDPR